MSVVTDTETVLDTGLPEGFSHLFKREDVARFAGTGTPIVSLCGHRQVVERNTPAAKPCVRCRDALNRLKGGHPGAN